jgi:hypothetical protein
LWPAFVGLFSFHSFALFNVFPNSPTKAGHKEEREPLRIVVIARAQKSHPLLFYSWHDFFSWQGFSMGTYNVWEKQGALGWHLCTMSREVSKTLISWSSGKTFEQGLFQRNQYFHQWFTSQYCSLDPLT